MAWSVSGAAQNFSPSKEALRLFLKYKPTIERTNHAVVDEPVIVPGDINGDSLQDCIIFFIMTPADGGNAIIGRQAAIYINTGKKMKVTGAFPSLGFCYVVDRIFHQVIYVKEYKCRPPYNEYVKEHRFVYQDGSVKENN